MFEYTKLPGTTAMDEVLAGMFITQSLDAELIRIRQGQFGISMSDHGGR